MLLGKKKNQELKIKEKRNIKTLKKKTQVHAQHTQVFFLYVGMFLELAVAINVGKEIKCILFFVLFSNYIRIVIIKHDSILHSYPSYCTQ